MIDMQLLNGALLALLIVVGAAIALSLAMVAAASVSRPGQTPRGGGTRRELPRRPVPDDDYLPREPVPEHDRVRELVLR
jgi:hypothetical protein